MKFFTPKKIITILLLIIVIFLAAYFCQKPPTNSDWRTGYGITASSQLNNNFVTIKNIRNFQYGNEGSVTKEEYYDKTYNLDDLTKVWYIYEPFGNDAAHNFLSFEFKDNIFLTISIEARTTKKQEYDGYVGLLRSYPLIYVIADEKDALYMRTNIRKNQVVLFPTKATPENSKKLLLELLSEVNNLDKKPKWYNSLTDNCTTLIAKHINNVWPNSVPFYWTWKMYNTHSAEIAYDKGWIDTTLSLNEAKTFYNITKEAQTITDINNYSTIIRKYLVDKEKETN